MKGLIINLPEETLDILEKLGKLDSRKRKPYIEKVLSDHAKKNKKKLV